MNMLLEINDEVSDAITVIEKLNMNAELDRFHQMTRTEGTVSTSNANTVSTETEYFEKCFLQQQVTDLTSDIKQLAKEYQTLKADEVNAEKSSNKRLYIILSKCLQKYEQILMQSDESQSHLEKELDRYILANSMSISGKTYFLSKILMCVFSDADTKKINCYYSAITYAQDEGRNANNLVEYIEDSGGIQAMRLAKSAKRATKKTGIQALTREQKIQYASKTVFAQKVGVIESSALAEIVQTINSDQKIMLLATEITQGKYVINGAVIDEQVMNAALLAFYKDNKNTFANQLQEWAVEQDRNILSNAINQVIEEIK